MTSRNYIVTIHDSGPPVSDSQIRSLENRLGDRLPISYRKFLLKHNGGQPEPNVFTFVGGRDKLNSSCLQKFFRVADKGMEAFGEILDVFRGRVPADLCPIAYDVCGNLICVCLSGENINNVFFWDHEEEYDDDEVLGYRNVYRIAEDFDAFLAGLHN